MQRTSSTTIRSPNSNTNETPVTNIEMNDMGVQPQDITINVSTPVVDKPSGAIPPPIAREYDMIPHKPNAPGASSHNGVKKDTADILGKHYHRWTTAFQVLAIFFFGYNFVVFNFSTFLFIFEYRALWRAGPFFEKLIRMYFVIGDFFFLFMAIHSTTRRMHLSKRKKLAFIGLAGFIVMFCLQVLLVFYQIIPGIQGSEATNTLSGNPDNAQYDFTIQYVVAPVS